MAFKQLRLRSSTGCLLAASGLALLGVNGCHSGQTADSAQQELKTQAKQAKNQLSPMGDLVMEGSELSGHDTKGRLVWKVGASQIHVAAGEDQAQPRHANLIQGQATLYREGKPESSFQAKNIEFFDTAQGVRMVMSGGVQAQTTGPWTGQRGPVLMQSPRAEVNVKTRRLLATQVQMTQAKTHVVARALTADTGLAIAQLHGDVKATAPEGVVVADEATWKWHEGRAQAYGKVKATHDATIITGARLDADSNIKQGALTGGVRVAAPQGQAQASTVHYNWGSGALSAQGGVTLVKDNATLTAARIDTDNQLNHATSDGAVVLHRGDTTLHAGSLSVTGKMTRAVAGGGVTFVGPDTHIKANHVELTNIDAHGQKVGQVTATGDAQLERNGEAVTAQRVEISDLDMKAKTAGRIVGSGGVFARNKDGDVRAAHVTWSNRQIVAQDNVTLHKADNTLSGEKLQTDDKFQTATLSGNVRGHLAPNVTVGANSLLWQRVQGHIIARGNVTAQHDTLRLRGDRMDATTDGNNATLTGHVVVTSNAGTVVRAPTARYAKLAGKKGQIYASDGVWFHDAQHGLEGSGKSLVYDMQSREAVIVNGTT
ncbi:MAG: hypothetical protein JOZ57_07830, partial [Abitibacteriaceae bacterium]|nr:hypothetical protein [Abditibacteriaceae bacterium]